MALDATRLGNAIKAGLLANPATNAQNNASLDAVCAAIAAAVVAEITANGVVLPTALVAPPGTSGGPVTGTGSIT